MNVIKTNDQTNKKIKPAQNNFERRHPELAKSLKKIGERCVTDKTQFVNYLAMIAEMNADFHNRAPCPCRTFFYGTRARHGVADIVMNNFWGALKKGSTFVGTPFSDFSHIADPKTLRRIASDAVESEFLYKDLITPISFHPANGSKFALDKNFGSAKYIYFPTPIFIRSWMEIVEDKFQALYKINITQILDRVLTLPRDIHSEESDHVIRRSKNHAVKEATLQRALNEMDRELFLKE